MAERNKTTPNNANNSSFNTENNNDLMKRQWKKHPSREGDYCGKSHA